ncbi:MAG: HAMP domain-containing protein [Rhodospirillaceae bacterium]|nr:HAMP domain-containing protein [Rhodospirillaceae bacterium]
MAFEWLIGIERMLPRSLLGRSILIIVTPIVLLQVVSAWVFYDSHWETVTRRLAQSVAGEIGAIVQMMPRYPTPEELAPIFAIAADDMGLDLVYKAGEILPNDPTIMRQNLVDRQLARALESRVERPFIIDSRSLETQIEIHVQLADGVLHVVVARRRLFSSTTYVFLLWMVGTSLALLAVATLFMRNQVKPIKRLAQAADDFGKGREVLDFRTTGATEVALAGQAFNQMRNRIRRQIVQRTEMLAGVSHDLRTPLTRMKLQLAMMGDGGDIGDLKKDVADMERMIGAYLAFARGEGMEQPTPTDIVELVEDVASDARRHGAEIQLILPAGEIVVPLRRDAVRRALDNVVGNAQRYAGHITVTVVLKPRHVEVMVDDDGPGIPPTAREEVFKPFFRLEQSRNQETGGTGLGLTIARDIIRGHGGDLELRDSPQGGLRAVVRLPL